jgi:CRISPR-associated protein Cmr5
MNKRKVEAWLPKAIEALECDECKIQLRDTVKDENGNEDKVPNGKISKSFRGQISSFGAAVTMGSFKSAVAFFGKDGESGVKRSELIRAIYYITDGVWREAEYIVHEIIETNNARLAKKKEDFINASVAIKLAMNAFELVEEKKDKGQTNEKSESSVQ